MKKIAIVLLALLSCWACSEDNNGPEIDISGVAPGGSFTDIRDGQTYKCITIGQQTWMAENLNYRLPKGALGGCYTFGEDEIIADKVAVDIARFKDLVNEAVEDGKIVDPPGLPLFQRPSFMIVMYIDYLDHGMSVPEFIARFSGFPEVEALFQSFYDQLFDEAVVGFATAHFEEAEKVNDGYTGKYGCLYSYEGALEAIPEGWRLPADADWKNLEKFLGISENELDMFGQWRGQGVASFLKAGEEGIGFDALYGGCNAYTPENSLHYIRQDEGAYFWSSTLLPETDSTEVGIIRSLMIYDRGIMRTTTRLKGYKPVLYSVRCIKKEENE